MAENGQTPIPDVTKWPSPREMAYMLNQVLATNRSVLGGRADIAQRAGYQFGTDRDLYKVLGYKRDLGFEDYLAKYERQDIAARVVDAPAEETWRESPRLFDGEQDDTEFVKAVDALFKRLRAWAHIENVDALAGIGRYGVLLIGVSSGAEEEQLKNEVTEADPADVVYLRAYDEGATEIKELDKDPNSERFGMPLLYEIDLGEDLTGTANTANTTKVQVHWSRVIHVAEYTRRSLVYGTPRMRAVYNRLDDLEKVVGGGAEAFWKLVYKGLVFSLKEGFAAPSDQDEVSELQNVVQDYVNDLRRFMFTPGYDVHELGGQTVDPSGMVDVIISIVSGKTGIPKRLLLGSERGELASTQDASNWAGRITGRRTKYAEPVILNPLVDRLIQWGAVPAPSDTKNGYRWEWQPLFELTELEQADVALKYAQAANTLTGGFGTLAITEEEWREEFTPLSGKPQIDTDFDALPALPGGESDEAMSDVTQREVSDGNSTD